MVFLINSAQRSLDRAYAKYPRITLVAMLLVAMVVMGAANVGRV